MQLIIASLKASLHLTPFCFLDLLLAIINEKFYVLNIGFVILLIKTFLLFDWQFDFPPFWIF